MHLSAFRFSVFLVVLVLLVFTMRWIHHHDGCPDTSVRIVERGSGRLNTGEEPQTKVDVQTVSRGTGRRTILK